MSVKNKVKRCNKEILILEKEVLRLKNEVLRLKNECYTKYTDDISNREKIDMMEQVLKSFILERTEGNYERIFFDRDFCIMAKRFKLDICRNYEYDGIDIRLY